MDRFDTEIQGIGGVHEMEKTMEQEIAEIRERNKCQECKRNNQIQWCMSCRLAKGNSYFLPNLFCKIDKSK